MYIRTGLAPISDESAHDQSKKSKKILEYPYRAIQCPQKPKQPEIRMQYPKKEDAINFLISKNSEKSSKKTGVVRVLCMGGRVDRADGRMVL